MDYIYPGYRQLASAILLTAVQDVQKGNAHAGRAKEFLAGEEGCEWFELLDIHPDTVASGLDRLPGRNIG